jgi:hypothetical protein
MNASRLGNTDYYHSVNPSYKDMIDTFHDDFNRYSKMTKEEIPELSMYMGSYVDCMLSLLRYEKKLNDEQKRTNRIDCCDDIIRFLLFHGTVDIRVKNKNKYDTITECFGYFKDQFYEEYPVFSSGIHLCVEILKDEIFELKRKVTTLEQYQANLLDKISVFAEMIDNKKNA